VLPAAFIKPPLASESDRYKGDRNYQYYLGGLKVNGKRNRLFLNTEKEALEELKKRGKQLCKEGKEG
jgi:hypothetical protein